MCIRDRPIPCEKAAHTTTNGPKVALLGGRVERLSRSTGTDNTESPAVSTFSAGGLAFLEYIALLPGE